MEVKEHLEALSLALKTEEDGYQFFSEMANKASNEFARKLFQTLAMDEMKHIALIKKFYEALVRQGKWEEIRKEDLKEFSSVNEIRTVFKEAVEKAKKGEFPAAGSDIEAYEHALKFEDDGATMYEELYQKSTDQAARVFYAFLRDMEQGHYDTFKRAIDYLKNPADYFILEEGWTMED